MTIYPSDDNQCDRGHDLKLVGRDAITGLCNQCAAALRRLRKKHDGGPKPRTIDDQATEAIRTNTLLDLYDQKDRAATTWERQIIQQQIDAIK